MRPGHPGGRWPTHRVCWCGRCRVQSWLVSAISSGLLPSSDQLPGHLSDQRLDSSDLLFGPVAVWGSGKWGFLC